MEIHQISENISYLDMDTSIICSSLGIIRGENYSVLVDLGASFKQVEVLKDSIKENKAPSNITTAIITHFHPDHISNIKYFPDLKIIGSKNTARYMKVDTIIDEPINLDLGKVNITIFPLPSIHAKGSLGIYVNEDKTVFIGDALCLKEKDGFPYTNKDVTMNMVLTLRKYKIEKYILGHEPSQLTTESINEYLDYLYSECKKSKNTEVYFKEPNKLL